MKNHEYFDPDNPGSGPELPPDGDYTGELAENPQQEEYSLPEDVDQIVQEVKQDFHQPDEDALSQPGVPVEEFRDQEYRDAFDENFERACLAGDDASQDAPPPILPRLRRRRPRRKPIKKKGSGLLGIPHFLTSLILCAIVIAVGVTLGRILWLCADDVLALTKPEQQATVVISDTDTMDEIAEKLASAGLIRYPQLFSLYCDITSAREKISAGEFELNGVYDYNAMVNAISGYSSERTIVEVMIPEGYECRQIFEKKKKNGVCTVEELEDAARNMGASGLMTFLKVKLPIILPSVMAVFALNFNALFTEYDMSATFASSYGTTYAMVIQSMCEEEGMYGYNVNASGRRCASTVFIMVVSGIILYLVYGVGGRDLGDRLELRDKRKKRREKLMAHFKRRPEPKAQMAVKQEAKGAQG